MALNFSHRSVFQAHTSEENLVSPMRIVNGYIMEGISDKGERNVRREVVNDERDKVDKSGSPELVSKDIIDLLPSDPFGMDISTTITAITGWLEDLEVDYGGYGKKNIGATQEEYGLFAGFDLIQNRFQSVSGNMLVGDKSNTCIEGRGLFFEDNPTCKSESSSTEDRGLLFVNDNPASKSESSSTENRGLFFVKDNPTYKSESSNNEDRGLLFVKDKLAFKSESSSTEDRGLLFIKDNLTSKSESSSTQRVVEEGTPHKALFFVGDKSNTCTENRGLFFVKDNPASKSESSSTEDRGLLFLKDNPTSKSESSSTQTVVEEGTPHNSLFVVDDKSFTCTENRGLLFVKDYPASKNESSSTQIVVEEGTPHEALFFVLSYLEVCDLLSVERVCSSLCSMVRNDPFLWRSIHIDQPLNDKITDDALLKLTSRAQSNLQCLSLVECPKITDDGLKLVLESNPRLNKLCVPGCTRLSIEGIVNNLKFFKYSKSTTGIKHLRIGGLYGVTHEHFEELKFLLGANGQIQQDGHKPHFYHWGNFYLLCDDDRAIDIEICPRCQKLRLVYDCAAEGCQATDRINQICRACTLCIPRCVQCGRCINDGEYEETFFLEMRCSYCYLPRGECQTG